MISPYAHGHISPGDICPLTPDLDMKNAKAVRLSIQRDGGVCKELRSHAEKYPDSMAAAVIKEYDETGRVQDK